MQITTQIPLHRRINFINNHSECLVASHPTNSSNSTVMHQLQTDDSWIFMNANTAKWWHWGCWEKKKKKRKQQTIRLGLGSEEPPEPGRTCRHGYRWAAPLPSISRPLSFMSLFVQSREIAIAVSASSLPAGRRGRQRWRQRPLLAPLRSTG